MPRKIRIEYPGAIYHVMSRGDRREDVLPSDVALQDFIKTLAEAFQKTACLLPYVAPKMEARRRAGRDEDEWKRLRRGWYLGGDQCKKEMLDRMETKLDEHHSGELKREIAEAKAEKLKGEEMQRLGWTAADLSLRRKNDAATLEIASRLRAETTIPLRWIAHRLQMGSCKSATTHHCTLRKTDQKRISTLQS